MGSSRKPGRADLLERVRYALLGRVHPGTRLCLGLSGGLDSMVLLHLLAGLRTELDYLLSAVHIHHGLSPNADAWAEFCASSCRALDVPLQVERVQVARRGEHGLEAAARQARYQVFARLAVDFVVLAHHQDDQAETVMFNLLRGTGVAGMAAMPVERMLSDSGVSLLRPLLEAPRAQIERYARRQGIAWVEDESNLDVSFARNHLRRVVLPDVESRFPAYRDHLSRAARHFAECSELLAQLARLDAAQALDETGLDLTALAALPRARAKNLLRWYLTGLGQRPWAEARLEAVLDQLLAARPDNRIAFSLGESSLRVWRGRLQVVPAVVSPAATVVWQGERCLPFAGGELAFNHTVGAGISLTRLAGRVVTFRRRSGGEHLRPDCRRPRRSLKQLCQEGAIPPWERDELPLLYAGSELVWVAGLGADCAWQATVGEAGLLIAWRPAGR